MELPSFKEAQLLREAARVSESKRKQLLSKNKEAARALLSAISIPQVSRVTELKPNVNT